MRAPLHGMLEAGWMTFGLLIAIRAFQAPDEWKAAISSAGFIGMLINTFVIALVSRTGRKTSQLVAGFLISSAVGLIGAAYSPNLGFFLTFFLLAQLINIQQAPLMIEVYASNYSPSERGSKLSTAIIIAGLGGIVFSTAGGRLLDYSIGAYPLILLLMALACVLNAALVRRIPSKPLARAEAGNPFKSISLLWTDRFFGLMLTAWMLLGFGNLMMLPLRVEYVANPRYGLNLTNEQIALLTFALPMFMRLLSTRVWGVLFDRMHFIAWRNCVNACFLASILIFFNSTSMTWLIIGSALDGIGRGGGLIGWNLWVTKIAPPEKVSSYMSVHTGLTGLRGSIAPFIGFTIIMEMSPMAVSFISSGFMLLSMLMFLFLAKSPRLAR